MSSEVAAESLGVLFIFMAILLGGIVRELAKKWTFIPYTPTLFVIGLVIGLYSQYLGVLGKSLQGVINMDPHGLLSIFLPPLIFDSGFNADWHIFRKQAKQILVLAFPSVIVSAFLIMLGIKLILNYDDSYYSWIGAFLFGSIVSCTDTVAVLALLKQAGAPKKFNSLIEGESLFNDGTCMVLFTICAQYMNESNQSLSAKGVIWLFLTLTIGGTILGVIGGVVSSYLIGQFRSDPILSLNISFCSCFVLFFIAENVNLGIKVSGILALVSMGLYMAAFGKTRISPQAKQTVHYFWQYIIYVAETVIFVVAGIIVGGKVLTSGTQFIQITDLYKLGGLYLMMMVARFIAISVFMPLLSKWGYGLTWKQVIILTYGGLRGAIGIAFALIVSHIQTLDAKYKSIVLFHMAGCALLTLVINAPTAGWIIKKIGLSVKSPTRQKLFLNFMEGVEKDLYDRLHELKSIKYLQDAQWSKVEEFAALKELKEIIAEYRARQNALESKHYQIEMQNPNRQSLLTQKDNLDPQVLCQFRNRFLIALKGLYWQKFQNHQCTSDTVIILTEAADWDLDDLTQPLNSWDYLESTLKNPEFVSFCFKKKDWPLVGKLLTGVLFNYIGSVYDIISTYLDTMQECELQLQSMHADKAIIDKISQQSQDNRDLARDFLDEFIKVSFPEIALQIQINKITQSIITYGKLVLNTHHQYGQIDDNQYSKIKGIFDKRIEALEHSGVAWNKPQIPPIQYLKQCEFFNNMKPQELTKLLESKIDLLVEKAEFIIREDQKARYLYYIIRGEGSEESSKTERSYKRKLGKYQIIGAYNALQSNLRYFTNVCADSIMVVYGFPLKNIMDIVKHNEQAQGYLYKFCLPLLVKLDNHLQGLCAFSEKQLIQFSKKMIYRKVKNVDQVIERSYADIIFTGSIKFGQDVEQAPIYISHNANPSVKVFSTKSNIRMLQLSQDHARQILQAIELRSSYRRTFGMSRNTNNYFIPSTQTQKNHINYFRNNNPGQQQPQKFHTAHSMA